MTSSFAFSWPRALPSAISLFYCSFLSFSASLYLDIPPRAAKQGPRQTPLAIAITSYLFFLVRSLLTFPVARTELRNLISLWMGKLRRNEPIVRLKQVAAIFRLMQ